MPDGDAVTGDLGIIHDPGNAVRVGDVLGCIQVVDGTLQRGIAMGGDRPHGIQIHLAERDFPQHAVVFHFAVSGGDCVGILVGGGAALVGAVGPGRILVLDFSGRRFADLGNGHGGFHAAAGDELGPAVVGWFNVGVVVGIVQPKDGQIVGGGDFNVIGPFAQRCVRGAGVVDVGPIAVVTGRCFGFHEDELALIALRIIQGMFHRIGDSVGRVIEDRIGAIALAFHGIGIVPAAGLVFPADGIPLVDFKDGIALNGISRFTVGLSQIDLQGPFVVVHRVGVGGIGRDGDGLQTAKAAPVFLKTIRDADFLIAELQRGQLVSRCGQRAVHHALRLIAQLGNGRFPRTAGSGIRALLRGIGANGAAAGAAGL